MADADLERKSWDQPEGASFDDWMEGRVARYALFMLFGVLVFLGYYLWTSGFRL